MKSRYLTILLTLAMAAAVGGCAGGGASTKPAEVDGSGPALPSIMQRQEYERLNQQVFQQAQAGGAAQAVRAQREYRVGPGDQVVVRVSGIPEYEGFAQRVDGEGRLNLPLLGRVPVAALTVAEIEDLVTEGLAADFIRDPRVMVVVSEHRSSEVTVGGAVRAPSIYSLDRPRTLLEILSLAGGLSPEASTRINVHTTAQTESGDSEKISVVVNLEDLLSNPELNQKLVLGGGDSIYVPSAGYVYVEGKVEKPGAYRLEGNMNVLKALAVAGGTSFEAASDEITVFRAGAGPEDGVTVDLDEIRRDPSSDVVLQDGDIVVVGDSKIKSGLVGLWKGVTGLFFIF